MQKAKEGSVVVEGFLSDLLSNFKTLTEISRKFSIAYLCCLLLTFIATSSTYISRAIYNPSGIYRFKFSHSQLFIL